MTRSTLSCFLNYDLLNHFSRRGQPNQIQAYRHPYRLYSWNPTHGRRRRGRPRTAWKDTINKDINKMDLGWSVEEAEVAAKDRSVWKFLVNQAAGASINA